MSDFNGFGGFDAQQAVDENPPKSYEPIPNGWYPTAVVGCEWKPTQNDGKMLVFKGEVLEGQHKGTWSWSNCNLVNQNTKTVAIAKGFLGALAMAVGIRYPKNESELMNKPVDAKWVVVPEKNGYPAKNEIKDWKPLGTMTGGQGHTHDVDTNTPAGDGVTGTPRVGSPTGNKKPWEK